MHDPTDTTRNGHSIGIILKELIRRAIVAIRNERFVFEAQAKQGYSGAMDDLVTSADYMAQEVIINSLRECFPDFGIIAEEKGLAQECTLEGEDIYFTVDPLDGTKAFVRRQSHGIGTMISLVSNGRIESAYIGDVMTGEIYGYRPGSDSVYRISEYNIPEKLGIDTHRPLSKQYLLLRDDFSDSPLIAKMVDPETGLFAGFERTGGSFGVGMARLWKGELGAAILHNRYYTPWDTTPVMGICEKLGFCIWGMNPMNQMLRVAEKMPTPKEPTPLVDMEGVVLIGHRSRQEEILSWLLTG